MYLAAPKKIYNRENEPCLKGRFIVGVLNPKRESLGRLEVVYFAERTAIIKEADKSGHVEIGPHRIHIVGDFGHVGTALVPTVKQFSEMRHYLNRCEDLKVLVSFWNEDPNRTKILMDWWAGQTKVKGQKPR